MPTIVLASALARWLEPASAQAAERVLSVDGDTLQHALDAAFRRYPRLRGYLLDEHGSVRHHVAIFIDGRALRDKRDLQQPVAAASEIYLLQALSGG